MNKGLMVGSRLLGTIRTKKVGQKVATILDNSKMAEAMAGARRGAGEAGFRRYIRRSRNWRVAGSAALMGFLVLMGLFFAPLYYKEATTTATVGTANLATTSLELVTSGKNTASATVNVTSSNGSFANSVDNGTEAAFKVTSNNFTGYTLKLAPASGNTNTLASANGASFSTITDASGISAANFSQDNATGAGLNGKWGIGSRDSSTASYSTYYPASSTITVGNTTAANATTSSYDTYYVGLGVRAGYTQAAGDYSSETSNNTYVLTATGNAIGYKITFSSDITDTVSNLPTALSGAASATNVTLTNDKTPTRTGYTFSKWCLGTTSSNGTVCNGTTFNAGANFGIDQTADNRDIKLYAVWTINSYTQTVNYYCQTAAGAEGTKYTYTETLNYNTTFTFTSAKATSCYNSTSHDSKMYNANTGTTEMTINYTVTGATTNTTYFHRNTRTITLAAGTGIGSVSASGTGVKSNSGTTYTVYYGGTVTLAATPSTGYAWLKWTNTSGGSDFSTTQGYSFSSVTSNYGLTANGQRAKYNVKVVTSNVTSVTFTNSSSTDSSRCPTVSAVTNGNTASLCYGVAYTLTQNFSGTYAGYEFSSWALNNSSYGTLSSTTAKNPTFTPNANSGSAQITATGKSSVVTIAAGDSTPMQSISSKAAGGCPSTLATGTAYKLTDSRDNNVYYVARLADGNCWMLDNLRLNPANVTLANLKGKTNASDTTLEYLKGSRTGTSSDRYATAAVAAWTSGYSYSAPLVNVQYLTTTTTGYGSGSKQRGAYYNYCAASAGYYCWGNGTNYSDGGSDNSKDEDICPKGWRMPTGGSSGEYQALCTAAWGSACSNGMSMAASNSKSLQVALSTPLSGYFNNGSFSNVSSYGYFWSSTRSSAYYMYDLYVNSSLVYPQDSDYRDSGFSVRCLLK